MNRAFLFLLVIATLTGCASRKEDRSIVAVEAIVESYGEDRMTAHGPEVVVDQKLFTSRLEVRRPEVKFAGRLYVHSIVPLAADHPLRQVGAVVTFMTEKKYLTELLFDPRKSHDFHFLYLDAILNLKKTEPNQSLQPTALLGRG
jgi:hypothetical protein